MKCKKRGISPCYRILQYLIKMAAYFAKKRINILGRLCTAVFILKPPFFYHENQMPWTLNILENFSKRKCLGNKRLH